MFSCLRFNKSTLVSRSFIILIRFLHSRYFLQITRFIIQIHVWPPFEAQICSRSFSLISKAQYLIPLIRNYDKLYDVPWIRLTTELRLCKEKLLSHWFTCRGMSFRSNKSCVILSGKKQNKIVKKFCVTKECPDFDFLIIQTRFSSMQIPLLSFGALGKEKCAKTKLDCGESA